MSEILFERYIIRIMGPSEETGEDLEAVVQQALSEAEENISDLLPEGYYCKIEEA